MESSDSNFISSCTSTYDARPSSKVSLKPFEWFRRSCAYEVLLCKNCKLDYLLWTPPTESVFLHAHLHMTLKLPIKFHQNPLSGLGREPELTRYVDSQTDGQTDRETDVWSDRQMD